MNRKTTLLAVLGLAAGLSAGTALAGHPGGISTPGKAYGHAKHYQPGHGHDGYRYERHYGSYGHRGHGYYRGPSRVVRYSRYEVHHHGPGCGHHGYTRSWYRSYSPYYRHDYHRDYGRAAFAGRDHGVRYYIEFDY